MNYLAHLYLSGDDENVITGNFIGDYVKGKNYLKYPGKIREGIILHRQIDSFTDTHPRFREVKKLLRPEFGLFSGIITDLLYDHFLAANWNDFAPCTLRQFTKKMHSVLLSHFFYLPSRVQGFLPTLIKNRRLESYATKDGMSHTLKIMSRYTSLPENAPDAMKIMEENFDFLHQNFEAFMSEMIAFVNEEFGVEIKRPGLITRP
jgi:acyl carrier protein phosphodiesterase